MLDDYFRRIDVSNFIEELKKNPKVYKKKVFEHSNYGKNIGDELALYIFYDALIKYKIIIDDPNLFQDYLAQIKKLYTKISNCEDLMVGIHRIICNVVGLLLGIKEVDAKENREEIIRYIYDKFILDGYYYHGFSTAYEKSIARDGFTSEIYYNYYSDMNEVNQLFEKYHVYNIMGKDFKNNSTYFTDDFIMSCYYSISSPGYFHNLLFNPEVYGPKVISDGYLVQDYYSSTYFLKKYMNYYSFSEEDKKTVNHAVDEEWSYLKRCSRKVSVLMVKRCFIRNDTSMHLADFMSLKDNIYTIVDRMLCPKNNQIRFNDILKAQQINVLSFEDFYRGRFAADGVDLSELNIEREEKEEKFREEARKAALIKDEVQRREEERKLEKERQKMMQAQAKKALKKSQKNKIFIKRQPLNAYGMASSMLLLGSICISLGVIITIVLILRGL